MDIYSTVFSIFLLVQTVSAYNPGRQVQLNKKLINTAVLVERIESTLASYVPNYGRLIHMKSISNSSSCLGHNMNSFSEPDQEDRVYYQTIPVQCDALSGAQQWRLVHSRLEVGSKEIFPNLKGGVIPCLDCHMGEDDCDFNVRSCLSGDDYQHFFIRIHASQIDFINSKVYFAIHSKAYPSKCLSIQSNSKENQKILILKECVGSDEQSFFLDLDILREIRAIQWLNCSVFCV